MDQIFVLGQVVEEVFEKKMYAAYGFKKGIC